MDEAKRATLGEGNLKSLDFIVYGRPGARLLIDVKGRRYPGGPSNRPRRVWETWSTFEDVAGMRQWLTLFGPGYTGLLVFTYQLEPHILLPADTADLFTHQGRRYLFRAVDVKDYHAHMRVRSPKWATVGLSKVAFGRLVRPLNDFLTSDVAETEAAPF